MKNIRRATTLIGAFIALGALAGCSVGQSTGSHASRVTHYSSVESLAADSALIVVGTVTEQIETADIDEVVDFTLSTVELQGTPAKGDGPESGDAVIVRQLGSGDQAGPAPFLEVGGTYLLYLTPSGLDGDLASQYYVTGGTAGLYGAAGQAARGDLSDATFVQLQPDEGDNLPAELTLAEAVG